MKILRQSAIMLTLIVTVGSPSATLSTITPEQAKAVGWTLESTERLNQAIKACAKDQARAELATEHLEHINQELQEFAKLKQLNPEEVAQLRKEFPFCVERERQRYQHNKFVKNCLAGTAKLIGCTIPATIFSVICYGLSTNQLHPTLNNGDLFVTLTAPVLGYIAYRLGRSAKQSFDKAHSPATYLVDIEGYKQFFQ